MKDRDVQHLGKIKVSEIKRGDVVVVATNRVRCDRVRPDKRRVKLTTFHPTRTTSVSLPPSQKVELVRR